MRSASISMLRFSVSEPDILDIREFDVVRIKYRTIIGNRKVGDASYLLEKLREHRLQRSGSLSITNYRWTYR